MVTAHKVAIIAVIVAALCMLGAVLTDNNNDWWAYGFLLAVIVALGCVLYPDRYKEELACSHRP